MNSPIVMLLKAAGIEIDPEALQAMLAQATVVLPQLASGASQLLGSLQLAHQRLEAIHNENLELKRMLELLLNERSDDARRRIAG